MLQVVNSILSVLLVLVFIYLAASWMRPNLDGLLGKILRPPFAFIEAILSLIRRVLPPRSGRDYSGLILFFLIWVIQVVING